MRAAANLAIFTATKITKMSMLAQPLHEKLKITLVKIRLSIIIDGQMAIVIGQGDEMAIIGVILRSLQANANFPLPGFLHAATYAMIARYRHGVFKVSTAIDNDHGSTRRDVFVLRNGIYRNDIA